MGSILLGILFIGFAYLHHKGQPWLLSNAFRNRLGNRRRAFQKRLIVPYALTGTLMIAMGVVERQEWLNTKSFVALYLGLAFLVLAFSYIRVRRFKKSAGIH